MKSFNKTPIPYGRHHITQDDIDAVVEVLKSDYLTQGPKVNEFEDAFASYIGAKYAVAVSNGTAALHLCAMALNVKPGDKVITTPITFAATANCVRYCGGEVVFADIDPTTYLLDINNVRKLLEASPKGTYKGIIPVDFAGRAVNLEEFRALADEFGCWIIEDACHAPGGYFTDSNGVKQNCGNGKYAELAIFSFHPVKHIATGEGGIVTTNNEELYKKLILLRTHGITKDPELLLFSPDFSNGIHTTNDLMTREAQMTNNDARSANDLPAWYYEMQELGYNYRITDFQAALGLSQLKRANEGLKRRREIALIYNKAFNEKPYIFGHSGFLEGHAYHLYIVEVENRNGLYTHLRYSNIFAQVHYIPVHLLPYYRQFGWKEGDMPNAENYFKKCLSLPMFPSLALQDQNFTISTINHYFNE